MAGKGWEKTLIPIQAGLVGAYPDFGEKFERTFIFPKDRRAVRQLSPNHWELGLSSDLLWCAAYGDSGDWYLALDTYLHSLKLHLYDIGLWTSEQYTGTVHGGFYLNGLFVARLAVRTRISRGGPLSPADIKLSRWLDEYTRRTFAYMIITADRTGEVICCGERMPKGPSAPQQSAVYREVYGLKHPNAKIINRQIEDDYWLSLRALRLLIEAKDDLAGVRSLTIDKCELPLTAHPIVVERWNGGHRAYYKTGGDGTCAWAWTHNGNVRWGKAGTQMPAAAGKVERVFTTAKRGKPKADIQDA